MIKQNNLTLKALQAELESIIKDNLQPTLSSNTSTQSTQSNHSNHSNHSNQGVEVYGMDVLQGLLTLTRPSLQETFVCQGGLLGVTIPYPSHNR